MAGLAQAQTVWKDAFSAKEFLHQLENSQMAQQMAEWEGYQVFFPVTRRLRCAQVVCAVAEVCGAAEPEAGWPAFVLNDAVSRVFPNHKKPASSAQRDCSSCCLLALRLLLDAERESLPFDPTLDFAFCTEAELRQDSRRKDYRRFLSVWRDSAIYEILRLSDEITPYCTLRHIAGVHFVAMTVARELKQAGAPLDLSLVSAAAAGHDIGKYGCMPDERVPYLHYYYTDRWFCGVGLPVIGQIAANHSTWDLELQNLSLESMLLIYADFRAKQRRGADGREEAMLYTLDDAFEVILRKLDNVDAAKKRRYELVYRKLHDFESYMRQKGVDTTLQGNPTPPTVQKDAALMAPAETYRAFRMMAVEHNLNMMHRFNEATLFSSVLSAAAGEKDWAKLRSYLSAFEEYVTYLSPGQKIETLRFLYELLLHQEGDIRRQAAALLGRMIARFNLRYKKELPASASPDELDLTQFALWKQYLQLLIYPDRKLTPQQRSHIHFTTKLVVASVLECCDPNDAAAFLGGMMPFYRQLEPEDEEAALALTDTLSYLPLNALSGDNLRMLVDFSARQRRRDSLPLKIAAMNFFCYAADTLPRTHGVYPSLAPGALVEETADLPALSYLNSRFAKACGLPGQEMPSFIVADIFVDNLKTATPWILKRANIELLAAQVQRGDAQHVLHIAAHFSNLIKASETIVVRYAAARGLMTIAPRLSFDQRNEIAVELGKGLEVGQYEFSKYIPQCLGEFSLYLRPSELDELLSQLHRLTSHSNDNVVTAALDTVGVMLEHSGVYAARYPQSQGQEQRRRDMVGILLKGMASYREAVQREAMFIFGETLYNSAVFSREDKAWLFTLCSHKLLFLLCENRESSLNYLYSSALLYHIYRFIIRYEVDCGGFHFGVHRKIAFFPGTFDPFTLSHKGIVKAIRDLGFEVYLAIDEFSWSKKTQPSLIRRRIASMSVADEFHVYVFPQNIPVNIASPGDLRRLKDLFPDCEVYLTVGSDVIRGASSYRAAPQTDSVHSMNHIVFRRVSDQHGVGDAAEPDVSVITGKVIQLQLPSQLEDISSTRIRENIDLNRDISNLIDPVVQEFIYQRGLYLRAPQYKPILEARTLQFDRLRQPPKDQLLQMCKAVGLSGQALAKAVSGILSRGDDVAVLWAGERQKPLALLSLQDVRVIDLFSILPDVERVNHIRDLTAGRLLVLTGVYGDNEEGLQMLLTETMMQALAGDCGSAVFCAMDAEPNELASAMLRCQGFLPLDGRREAGVPLLVDLNSPIVLLQNVETTIKAPFSNRPDVLEAIRRSRRRLKQALAQMYPGKLILSVSAALLHHRLLEKITALNDVPMQPATPRVLGQAMCVPFGKLLRGRAVPNTVTKTLHTDKVFAQDMRSHWVEAFPDYPCLADQIRTIKSFQRPVVLVDDLLHSGRRIRVVEPLMRSEGVEIKEVLVGILSGQGRDLMRQYGRTVDDVYFIPNLRAWYVESTLYPFIGGDTVRSGREGDFPFRTSVNLILPYAYPAHQQSCARPAVFRFSRVCLENTWKLLRTLENAYRETYAKSLTLSQLEEAIELPLCPDRGKLEYDANLPASSYLENDLTQLHRMRSLFE